MQAGRLDRRIVIEQNTPTRADDGSEVDSWAALATVWAEVRPKQGREFFASAQVTAEVDTIFRIRYRTDLDRKMRVNFGGDLYDIHSIGEIGRGAGLEILASAQVT